MATLSMSTRVGASCLLFTLLSIGAVAGCAEADTDGNGGEGGGPPSPTSSTTDASTTQASSSTGTPTSCTYEEGSDVGAECGVFVKAGAPATNDCSRALPCATIEEALTKVTSTNPRIFLCTSPIEEAIVLPGGVSIHGGFACSEGWSWQTDGRTPWTAGPDEIPLTFDGGSLESEVSGVDLSSADATIPGGSSIVIFANGGSLSLVRSSLAAGDGAPGEVGLAGVEGEAGSSGATGNSETTMVGGTGGASTCNAGGTGAQITCNPTCTASLPTAGEPGAPLGGGAAGANGPSSCAVGGEGANGVEGLAGQHAVGIGTIDEDGFHPALATAGQDGNPGTAGGGGGAKTTDALGGGGGGGAGCGATGGGPGMTGGSSIAIVAHETTLSFTDVAAQVALAGDGALGGASALGGVGGFGGQGACLPALCPIGRACAGGSGGDGGSSGVGGSGGGGHALIIAYKGSAPSVLGLSPATPTTSQAGLPGDGASDGLAAVVLEFE